MSGALRSLPFRNHFLRQPLFVLTADQDWAPAWASEKLLNVIKELGVPLHIFRTNPCPVLDNAFKQGLITQGWHPNFRAGSSHGATTEEVIAHCNANFPSCRTVRAHCFMEHSMAWDALAGAGIIADSQVLTRFQDDLAPILHASGIWRFPVFFEDDTLFRLSPGELRLTEVEETIFTPGLKILNFHPTFFAANVPSTAFYGEIKGRWFEAGSDLESLVHRGRGTRDVMVELIALVHSRRFPFHCFETVVDKLLNAA